MYLICEYYGERPHSRDLHIRKLEGNFAAVGGAINTTICLFKGKLYDHPTPDINKRDLSKICPTCRRLYKKAIASK